MAEMFDAARKGARIRITRHGKAVGWIIGEAERNRLTRPATPDPTVAKRRSR